MKNTFSIYLTLCLLCFFACKSTEKPTPIQSLTGKTMGTYYAIKYSAEESAIQQEQIDSLLIAINSEVSTYEPQSTISQINQNHQSTDTLTIATSAHFIYNFDVSKAMYQETQAYFDPTVMPLVNFWGFGYDKKTFAEKDTTLLDSLRVLVDFDAWNLKKQDPIAILSKPINASLDFSAVAKGYAVDQVCLLLESYGLMNYLVDIGGESRIKGQKNKETDWIIGINTPKEDADIQDIELRIHLNNKAIATSGNYRNFYEENGIKYVHTINPFTGYSEKSNLLSASIIHSSCAKADALATACMVMGLKKSIEFIDNQDEFQALFIFTNESGQMEQWQSKNFAEYLVQ